MDFIRWMLGSRAPVEVLGTGSSSSAELQACGVLDNATMYIKFQGGITCNIMMSRGSTYGYDQRCEVYGDKGIASIRSTNESSLCVGDAAGIHQAPLQFSFPQCFREAFELEIETFVSTLLYQTPWPICEEDCVVAQLIATTAKESCRLGRMLPFQSTYTPEPVLLRPVGNGKFAKHMLGVLSRHDEKQLLFTVLPPYSPSSTLSYDTDVLSDGSVQAVYVCSPDKLHLTHAKECLHVGKHVLVEKPVYQFEQLMTLYNFMSPNSTSIDTATDTAFKQSPVLMVGFHRRFDSEFLRAKQSCRTRFPQQILIESRDPVPAECDLPFVLRNSMCHDIDLVHWLLSDDTDLVPSAVSVLFTACSTDVRTSHIELTGRVTITRPVSPPTTTEPPIYIDLKIIYCKENKSYVQKCVLDGIIFGYDFHPPEGAQNPFFIYEAAYTAQWECFASLIREAEGRRLHNICTCLSQCKCNSRESAQREQLRQDRARWEGYRNTFASLAQAEELLRQSIREH